jgi:hypothetical protein
MAEVRTSSLRIEISRGECRQLHIWLADNAPFVRHQLSVIYNGGEAAISVESPEERQHVWDAITAAGRSETLGPGLLALRAALTET